MRHTVSIGDEIMVRDCLFIVTGIRSEMNKPAVLITKQPVELLVKEGNDGAQIGSTKP